MTRPLLSALLALTLFPLFACSEQLPDNNNLGKYLETFDYHERRAMKIDSFESLLLLEEGRAQLLDIRFHEEHAMYSISFAKHIPLNELPQRLDELDRDKLVITMCPIYDRAAIARLYLVLNGFEARYLTDGMLGMMKTLRGDTAREYYEVLRLNREPQPE
ncbi:rhodanese-like domain-containing protein [Desulfurispirillum indicum]|uniref:Rhodanese domain protein n=1 Tax=Desulfurispirillum indicum (strain ATCC BAA-1389 / DSM 22839 / S5) TaxID=653733 RepID=E6W752_DESIS|nr:rhodanese-like domain-containing protein [Desulfurispirillum indicum]ADU65130.1 Rhodanese domain protein [Desulfurispirillum indicum S5]UCZ57033.1 rhodanese-like domain-containing protein [Desulfurispirillum indicum]